MNKTALVFYSKNSTAAIGKGNDTQTTMMNSYISANASRKKML